MHYTVLLITMAALLLWQAGAYHPFGLPAGWAAAILAVVGCAAVSLVTAGVLYAVTSLSSAQAGLWLKRSDGRPRCWPLALLMAPYMVLCWCLLAVMARLPRRPFATEVGPGLFLGRRPMPGDRRVLEGLGIDAVLDMCAEVPEARWLRTRLGDRYLSVPAMDITAPLPRQLREAVDWVRRRRDAGRRVLLHCAVGYGRSATLAVCVLVADGSHATPSAALQHLIHSRPGVSLNRAQQRAADAFAAGLRVS